MHGIILFGKPGSGKSTIGKAFAQMYDYDYISSGDIARHMAESDPQVASMLAGGRMAPEMVMRSMIRHEIGKRVCSKRNFVLDGFPRFDYQDAFLDSEFPNLAFIRVLIDVSDYVAVERSKKRNRDDDGAIMSRLEYYHHNTEQLTKHCIITIGNNDEHDAYERADKLYLEVSDKCH